MLNTQKIQEIRSLIFNPYNGHTWSLAENTALPDNTIVTEETSRVIWVPNLYQILFALFPLEEATKFCIIAATSKLRVFVEKRYRELLMNNLVNTMNLIGSYEKRS